MGLAVLCGAFGWSGAQMDADRGGVLFAFVRLRRAFKVHLIVSMCHRCSHEIKWHFPFKRIEDRLFF